MKGSPKLLRADRLAAAIVLSSLSSCHSLYTPTAHHTCHLSNAPTTQATLTFGALWFFLLAAGHAEVVEEGAVKVDSDLLHARRGTQDVLHQTRQDGQQGARVERGQQGVWGEEKMG